MTHNVQKRDCLIIDWISNYEFINLKKITVIKENYKRALINLLNKKASNKDYRHTDKMYFMKTAKSRDSMYVLKSDFEFYKTNIRSLHQLERVPKTLEISIESDINSLIKIDLVWYKILSQVQNMHIHIRGTFCSRFLKINWSNLFHYEKPRLHISFNYEIREHICEFIKNIDSIKSIKIRERQYKFERPREIWFQNLSKARKAELIKQLQHKNPNLQLLQTINDKILIYEDTYSDEKYYQKYNF